MVEKFKKSNLRGRVMSSEGYQIRVRGRSTILYDDVEGHLRVGAELVVSGSRLHMILFTGSIPDSPERPRAVVVDRIRRAFAYAGWGLTIEDAWSD